MEQKQSQRSATNRAVLPPSINDKERNSFTKLEPVGFFLRPPPPPHELHDFITADDALFQTIHMGGAVVDNDTWRLTIGGLVKRRFALDLRILRSMPQHTVTAFHECFGSPLKPATTALWRIGNVRWTGVSLRDILALAEPRSHASFVWSEGLDRGTFAGVAADRYQKDLPIAKALDPNVVLAYEINGQPLSKNRGGPVRLIVPGYFGTNSTKWISKIEVQDRRAPGPYTTTFYNIPDPAGPPGAMKPVWQVQVNSMIVQPAPNEEVRGPKMHIVGWAWSVDGIQRVQVSTGPQEEIWEDATVDSRVDCSWQKFYIDVELQPGNWVIRARATSMDGETQPLRGHRNHCHSVEISIT